MTLSQDISDFRRRDITLGGKTKPVLITGDAGPAIIVMHEVYGFTPTLARFCRWVRDAGFRVYAPILLGTPDAANKEEMSPLRILGLCVSREFTLLAANKSSAVTDWLRLLATQAHEECGGPGVGAIGLCLTGGFALAMAVDKVMLAPVLGEPSMPPPPWPAALDLSPEALDIVKQRTVDEGLCVRAYRFDGDVIARAARFETLQRALGPAFIGVTLPDSCGNPDGLKAKGRPPHSVFTGDLIDAPGEATRQAVEEVIGFFRQRLMK